MKKPIIATAVFLVSCISAFAGETALKMLMTNGETAWYVLNERPQISFSSDKMIITTDDASADVARADVVSMNFEEYTPALLSEIGVSDSFIRFTGNSVEAPGMQVQLYSVNGYLTASGYESVSTTDLDKGLYIARAGKQSLKIIIR
ncbi:MAG: hypothetical protein Q4C34_08575 [Bacteroidales bacterium]|nr:hypothetical protein [Bacteroidales bacterium]